MKHLRILLLMVLGGSFFFTACEKDPVSGTETPPTLTITEGSAYDQTVQNGGSTLTFKIKGTKGDSALQAISVFADNSLVDISLLKFNNTAAAANPVLLFAPDNAGFTGYQVDVKLPDVNDTVTYSLVVTAVGGKSSAQSVTVFIKKSGTPVTTQDLTFFNNSGSGKGAVDLDSKTVVSTLNDLVGDIKDKGNVSNVWAKKIVPSNGATIRGLPCGKTFSDLNTKELIKAAIDSPDACATVMTEADGSVAGNGFLVKTALGNYFAFKIKTVNTTGDKNTEGYVITIAY